MALQFLRDSPAHGAYKIGAHSYGVDGSPEVFMVKDGVTLTIGAFCSFASGSKILVAAEHKLDWITTFPLPILHPVPPKTRDWVGTKGDVVIGNDVWVGMNAMILSGVTIGDGAVIGAGAIVTKDVEPYAIVAGNPARLIRHRFEPDVCAALRRIAWWNWPMEKIREAYPLLLSSNIRAFIELYEEKWKVFYTLQVMHKGTPLLFPALVALFLTNCALEEPRAVPEETLQRSSARAVRSTTIAVQKSSPPSSNSQSAASMHRNTVTDEIFGFTLKYPSSWGEWSAPTIPSVRNDPAKSERVFSVLDEEAMYPKGRNPNITFALRRYDEGEYRYEEVCDNEKSVDLCDVMKRQDLLEEKAKFMEQAAKRIDGTPATIEEYYDPSGASLIREVHFYTPDYRVWMYAIYILDDFLVSKDTRNDPNRFLYDVATEILGNDMSDPIGRLSKMYPEELREMTAFYNDVDRTLQSIEIIGE